MKFSFRTLTAFFRHFFARWAKKNTGQKADGAQYAEKRLILSVKRPRLIPRFSQLIHLPRIVTPTERLILGIAGIIFVVSFLLLGNQLLNQFQTPVPARGGTYTEALIGQPQLINPLWADANDVDRDLTRLLYSGLFRYSSTLNLEPDMAERMEVSEDGKTYTITLRPNLVWHDGQPLTSADVAFTINAAKNPAYRSPRAADFKGVTLELPDSQTIKFILEKPFAPFPHSLVIGILPEHLWNDIPTEHARLAEFNLKPIGSGPFRFDTLKKTRQGTIHLYELKRFSRYHGTAPYLSILSFRFYPDYLSAAEAVSQGNVDGLAFIPHDLREGLTKKRNIVYHRLELPQVTALFFNQKQNAVLQEKSIREALARSVDRNRIISEAFENDAVPAFGPMLPGFLGYTDSVPKFEFDIAAAESLLDAAGFKRENADEPRKFVPKNTSDKRFVADSVLKVSLATINIPEYIASAELIQATWQGIGIETEIVSLDPRSLEREVIPNRQYEILLHGLLLGADPDPYPFWHSSQVAAPGVNLSGYANRRVDALLEEARTLQDPNERAKRYEEFQTTVVGELPAIFLLTPSYTYAMDQRVQGVDLNFIATPADRFGSIMQWYTKIKQEFTW
ncbi:MAG: peptide ABC transporter substrate-binding protein [bacterium]|nr:peptide ABC transporter substrate-binding protein [bacterium]